MDAAQKPRVFYGYIIVTACFFIMATYWGTTNSYGIFFDALIKEFGWSRAATSGVFSLMAVMFGFTGIFTARLCDRYNPRIVIGACGVIMGIGYLLLSQVRDIWQLYVFFGIFIASGMGSYISLLPMVARWFTRRRALMTGVLCSGMGLGSIIFPPIAEKLIAIYQWRFSFIIFAIIVLVVVLIAAQFLKRDPQKVGLRPYGENLVRSRDFEATGLILRQAVRTRQFWLIGGLYFTFLFCQTSVLVHIFLHALGQGVSSASAANIVSVFGVLQIAGMNVNGLIADRFGARAASFAAFTLMTIGFILLLVVARDAMTFYIFAAIAGLAGGGLQILSSMLVADVFGLKSHSTILGSLSFMASFGGALGPFAAGYIYDINHSYTLAFIICNILAALAILYTALIRPIANKKRRVYPEELKADSSGAARGQA